MTIYQSTYSETSAPYVNATRDVRPMTASQLMTLDTIAIILGALIILAPLAMAAWYVPRMPLL